MQKIWCLSSINQSPTSDAIVAETLARAQKVSYDLAIAKKAM